MQVETVKQRCYHLKYQSEICGGTILVREIYENELSLICDQRYCVQDMERQLGLVLDFETTLGDKVNIQWQR